MEDLTAEIPNNEKSCQTEELNRKCPVLRPGQNNHMPSCCTEPGDTPLLQRPVQTSKSGILQIIDCFCTGTTQLKHILLKEVDTIFECKLCRSLFRGLPNLITHKEYYCFTRLPAPEPSGNCRQSTAIKELVEVIRPRPQSDDHVVQLEPIPSNQNAVFQHLTKESDVDLHSPGRSSDHNMDGWTHNQSESQEQDMVEDNTDTESESKETDGEDDEAHTDKHAEDEEEQVDVGVENEISGGMDDVTITCCLCGKDFNSRRSLRRHCREVHKQRLEELRKFTETHTVPIGLLSVVKEQQGHSSGSRGNCCPVCFKIFATKANVRRHFSAMHSGRRRDLITVDMSAKSSDPEVMSAGSGDPLCPNTKPDPQIPQYNLDTCKCLVCKRRFRTQLQLMKHMHFVHKVRACKSTTSSFEEGADTRHGRKEKKLLEKPGEEKPLLMWKPKMSLGFDFKKLFCKLCKRQFSSRQNLAKHIELHTDNGSDIFVKFYRCPLCQYESRRKRDVVRHVTVVHKKPSALLAKILSNLESRAVKKPVETVLGGSGKPGQQKGDTTSSHSPKKDDTLLSVPSVTGKQSPSPPVTRRQSLTLHTLSVVCNQNSNGIANGEVAQDSSEVHVTKNFSLHTCDICGRAFAKKVYLESHKRSHRNAANSEGRAVGVCTRSRSLV